MPEWLKMVIGVPVCALLMVPPYYLGSWLLRLRKISFGAAFLLMLFVGAILQFVSFVISPVQAVMPSAVGWVFYIVVNIIIAAVTFNYFVKTEEKTSIGFSKGLLLSVVIGLAGALILPTIVFIFVGVQNALS